MTPIVLKLNRIAQGLVSVDHGVEWFESCSQNERAAILRALAFVIHQAHPLVDEVPEAIAAAGLKNTFTPCVLALKANPPERALNKIIALPEAEQHKSFRLLLSLFSIADGRRRNTRCKDGCTHEWHNLGA